MVKKVFLDKKKLFTGKLNLELKKRIMKCLVWHCTVRSRRDIDTSRKMKMKLMDMAKNLKGSVGWIKSLMHEDVLRKVNAGRQIE